MLIVVSGLPGTGKSAVAEAVAIARGGMHLSIDTIEDALLGSGLPPSSGTGIAAYEAVRAAAEQNLALGRMVVIDAVNDSRPARETWRRAADHAGSALLLVVLELHDAAEHRRRLRERVRPLRHVAEPSWDQVQRRALALEPWGADWVRMDAGQPVDRIRDTVLRHLPGG